jgi:hypothetical protein
LIFDRNDKQPYLTIDVETYFPKGTNGELEIKFKGVMDAGSEGLFKTTVDNQFGRPV